MKKYVSACLVLCLILSIFAGCGSVSSSSDEQENGGFIAEIPAGVSVPVWEPPTEPPTEEPTEPAVGKKDFNKSEDEYDRPERRVIYLTFDDGPGQYTERLLNILSKYGVHVTFFVTHIQSRYSWLLAREASEGHSIGVHSYTHEYSEIYRSSEAYWDDFTQMQDAIAVKTGIVTDIMRFPGGSSNTVSNFNPGIMTQLADEVHDRGYQYFDWNVLSGDAGDTTDTYEILQNMKNGVMREDFPVILCHDIKEYTVNAIEDFVIWGLDNDYTFEGLTVNSYPAHHNINN